MISQKRILRILSVIILALTFTQTTQAKSVYVITDTEDSNLAAYKIEDANLVWQTNYICASHPGGDTGAVGLAIDESEYGDFLFVTFEGSNIIEMVNAKTMVSEENPVTEPNATNLAGIAFDQTKTKQNWRYFA